MRAMQSSCLITLLRYFLLYNANYFPTEHPVRLQSHAQLKSYPPAEFTPSALPAFLVLSRGPHCFQVWQVGGAGGACTWLCEPMCATPKRATLSSFLWQKSLLLLLVSRGLHSWGPGSPSAGAVRWKAGTPLLTSPGNHVWFAECPQSPEAGGWNAHADCV